MHHPARALAAILVATLGLAACTASEPEAQTQSAEPTDEPSTEPTEAAEPEAPVPANGEVLTTQEQIDAAKAAGLEVYTMNDGTKVAIDPEQPLPQPVVAEGVAAVQATVETTFSTPDQGDAAASRWARETGKNVIVIYPVYASVGDDFGMWYVVHDVTLVTKAPGYPGPQKDPQGYMPWLQSYIDQQPNPATWEIVVVPIP
jgi:hypothetical protein